MKTTCVLLVLASMIAFAVCASTFCSQSSDCNCPGNETAYCGVPVVFANPGGLHVGHTCHCAGLLSHCTSSCSGHFCRNYPILGHTVHMHNVCIDKHCVCLVRKGATSNP